MQPFQKKNSRYSFEIRERATASGERITAGPIERESDAKSRDAFPETGKRKKDVAILVAALLVSL